MLINLGRYYEYNLKKDNLNAHFRVPDPKVANANYCSI